jgi:hypothetical protein
VLLASRDIASKYVHVDVKLTEASGFGAFYRVDIYLCGAAFVL